MDLVDLLRVQRVVEHEHLGDLAVQRPTRAVVDIGQHKLPLGQDLPRARGENLCGIVVAVQRHRIEPFFVAGVERGNAVEIVLHKARIAGMVVGAHVADVGAAALALHKCIRTELVDIDKPLVVGEYRGIVCFEDRETGRIVDRVGRPKVIVGPVKLDTRIIDPPRRDVDILGPFVGNGLHGMMIVTAAVEPLGDRSVEARLAWSATACVADTLVGLEP